MPGMIFHMMVHATAGKPPILALLNDAAPITGCARWEETHDRKLVEPLWDFLSVNDGDDIRDAMENHLLVDESLHGPGTLYTPSYSGLKAISTALRHFEPLTRRTTPSWLSSSSRPL